MFALDFSLLEKHFLPKFIKLLLILNLQGISNTSYLIPYLS